MTREEMRMLRSFEMFTDLPPYVNPTLEEATIEKPRYIVRPMRADAEGFPVEEDLDAVVQLSHRDRHILLSSDLDEFRRINLYTAWFTWFPDAFALLERVPPDKNNVSIIGNTAILPLLRTAITQIENGHLTVLHLDESHLARKGEDSVLLFDTWVLHPAYKWGQCEDSRFASIVCRPHHGFGYILPLKHLGALWGVNKPLDLYVEPAATAMNRFISRVGFQQVSELGKKKPMFHFRYDRNKAITTRNASVERLTHKVFNRVAEYRRWWPEYWPQTANRAG